MAALGLNDPVTAFHYSTQPRTRSSSICIVIILVLIAVARIVIFKNIIKIVTFDWGGDIFAKSTTITVYYGTVP